MRGWTRPKPSSGTGQDGPTSCRLALGTATSRSSQPIAQNGQTTSWITVARSSTARLPLAPSFEPSGGPAPRQSAAASRLGRGVVLDVGEAQILGGRALERAAGRPPLDHLLDLLRQLEVFVGDALV